MTCLKNNNNNNNNKYSFSRFVHPAISTALKNVKNIKDQVVAVVVVVVDDDDDAVVVVVIVVVFENIFYKILMFMVNYFVF